MTQADSILAIANAALFASASRYLTDVEIAILTGAIADQTYEQIAAASGYSPSYVRRDVGPKLWQLLSAALGEKVSKRNFRQALNRYQQPAVLHPPQPSGRHPSAIANPPPVPKSQANCDWGEAPDVTFFLGRRGELATLQQWVVEDRCRLVALLGMGGIGKTSLSVKLAKQLQSEFEFVIWRSLRNAPLLGTLLEQIVPLLSRQQETQPTLNRLLHYLRSSKCLLIFDNVETLLHPEEIGQFLPDYENYGHLFQLAGEMAHASCVLITSREKPAVIAIQAGIALPVRSLTLAGLQAEADDLLAAKGLAGLEAARQTLIDTYGGNPLALKIAATSIQDLFDGDIADFLAQETILFNGLRHLLDQQFVRLSPLEQTLMYWLAVNRDWTTAAVLRDDIIPTASSQRLLEGLEALCRRSLLEKERGHYIQQPVVMEYVSNRLIEQIVDELTTAELNLFITQALVKTTVPEYVRESQQRLILGAIANEFQRRFAAIAALEQQVLRILTAIRRGEPKLSGYGSGNLINLCIHLGLDLAGFNFSGLKIWHACLQQVDLHNTNFVHADLTHSLFKEILSSPLCVAFSPDGQLLASGDNQGNLYVRQLPHGRVIQQFLQPYPAHQSWVRGVAFSPDSQVIASSAHDFTVKLWDIATGQCLQSLSHDHITGRVAWSPDGTQLATVGFDQTLRIWEAQTGNCLQILRGNAPQMTTVTWHPQTNQVACPGGDNSILVWDAESGQQLYQLADHTDIVWYVVFSPNGDTLASSSQDGSLKLWNLATRTCTQTVRGRFGIAGWLTFSPDSQRLVGGCQDGTLRMWDVSTGDCLKTFSGHTGQVLTVDCNPNGKLLASGSEDQTIKLWDAATGGCLQTFQGYSGAVWDIDVSSDGQQLASAHQDGSLRLWNAATSTCLHRLQGHASLLWSVAWHPQSTLLLTASQDNTLKLWNAQTGQCLKDFQEHLGIVHAVAWHPNGRQFASASSDGTIKIWDSRTGKCDQTLNNGVITPTVAWHPTGQLLASGEQGGAVKLWDPVSGNCVTTLNGHTNVVFSVAFSPEGQLLASGSHDHTVRLWQVQTGECLGTFTGHSDWIWSVAWHPAGDCLASASQDGTTRLWDMQTQQCVLTLEGHHGPGKAISWHPQGDWLATGSFDETIKLWEPQTGHCLNTLRAKRPYEGMDITGVTGLTTSQKVALQRLGAIAG